MGSSPATTDSTQTQTNTPYGPAAGALNGILGNVAGINPNLSPAESNALSGLSGNAGFLGQFTPQATANASNLLSGGGATATSPMINDAYAQYQKTLNPIANGSTNPWDTPGFGDAYNTMKDDIAGQVNGMFAGAGRDFSGANLQALGRGETQGLGQLIANQSNQNIANKVAAAGSLYGAGNTTGGILAGLNQQDLTNRAAGTGAATTAQQFSNDPYMQALSEEAARRNIPLQTLAQQAGIVLPAAQDFRTTDTTGTQTTTPSTNYAQTAIGVASVAAMLF